LIDRKASEFRDYRLRFKIVHGAAIGGRRDFTRDIRPSKNVPLWSL
jgi:hypothetical protein